MSEFLLEIGTEELPAHFANEAREQIRELSEKWLKENNINYNSLKSFSTPRRLVLILEGLAEKQPDITKELKGPAVSSAYDAEGNPTKALLGFCKSQNVDVEKLEKRDFKGNLFVFAEVKQEGKKTSDVLPEIIQYLLNSLSVIRGMRWGDYTTKFSRPIHWILALLEGKVLDFSITDIKASNYTYGHRFLGKGQLEVNSVAEYFKALAENHVLLDNEARKENIRQQLEAEAKKLNAKVLIPESLLNEVNQLIEEPHTIVGNFDKKYLEIPQVVNVTVMKSHQRYFPLFDQEGKLLPNFITISNMNLNPENIRLGNEKVLRARLEDAIFYYYEDLKVGLEKNLEELKRVTYFEEIGSIYDKVERIEKISLYLADNYFKELEVSEVSKAARLSKADLVTGMVQEFTELQGEIGYYYSLKVGEKEEFAIALKEQYLPTGANDSLPSTSLSQIINFADKLDNLMSCFALGKIPTGSKDPFSLRRQCLGIIRTCEKYKLPLNINTLFSYAFDVLAQQKNLSVDKNETLNKVKEFFVQRLKGELNDSETRYDLVDAILATENYLDDLSSVSEKLKALGEWVKSSNSIDTITALARIIRICKEKIAVEVNTALFEKDQEKDLYNALLGLKEGLSIAYSAHNFGDFLAKLETLVTPINNFFDNTMVMVDNLDLKNNRLALLGEIRKYPDMIANMDKILTA